MPRKTPKVPAAPFGHRAIFWHWLTGSSRSHGGGVAVKALYRVRAFLQAPAPPPAAVVNVVVAGSGKPVLMGLRLQEGSTLWNSAPTLRKPGRLEHPVGWYRWFAGHGGPEIALNDRLAPHFANKPGRVPALVLLRKASPAVFEEARNMTIRAMTVVPERGLLLVNCSHRRFVAAAWPLEC